MDRETDPSDIDAARNRRREHQSAYAREWWIKNRDKVREARKEARKLRREAENAWARKRYQEIKEQHLARKAAWRAANPQKAKAITTRWRAANPEKERAICRAWRIKNLDVDRARSAARRAMHASAAGKFTKADIEHISRAQRGKCAYCRILLRGKFHVDHITALSRGGTNHPSNLQLLCIKCNTSKGAKHPIEFAQSLGFLL